MKRNLLTTTDLITAISALRFAIAHLRFRYTATALYTFKLFICTLYIYTHMIMTVLRYIYIYNISHKRNIPKNFRKSLQLLPYHCYNCIDRNFHHHNAHSLVHHHKHSLMVYKRHSHT